MNSFKCVLNMSELKVNSYFSIWQINIWFPILIGDLLDVVCAYTGTGNPQVQNNDSKKLLCQVIISLKHALFVTLPWQKQ